MEVEDVSALNVDAIRQARENRKVPISLEDIAKSRKAQEEAQQRPVFLTKDERKRLREEAALERLAQTRKREAEGKPGNNNGSSRGASVQVPAARVLSSAEIAAAEAEKKEIALIKSSYLGKKEKKKKRRTVASSRSKFMFEWDTCEDTSTDLNPLYNRKHDITLGFGRGFFAGSDRTQQRTLASRAFSDLEQKRNVAMDALKDQEKVQQRIEKQKRKDDQQVLKARHWSEKTLEEMDTRDWRIFNEDFNIATRGTGLPHPLRNWDDANFPTGIYNVLKEIGYKDPTPIQRAAIPIGLVNRDLMGIAETGSGKTCAFILPMLSYILKQPRMDSRRAGDGPYAIILAPTRELAQQIDEEVNKFISRLGLRSVCIVGGAAMEQQTQRIREGAEIIIATPGRLNDCLRKRYLVLNQCNYIVLDEADRMLDMGFGDQVTDIFDAMPSSNVRPEDETLAVADQIYRQTFMFSATMPPEVERLAKKYLRNPAYVAIGDRSGKAVELIEQRVEFVTDNAKKGRLLKLLATSKPPIIVFMNQRTGCDAMARTLTSENYKVTVLHGGKVQDQRENSLEGFKSGRYEILVATDVAGRGIDVEGVTHVINYDAPKNIEIYMHRVGRTGRAGREGLATTFVTAADSELFPALRKVLMESGAKVPRELSQADRDMQRMITKF